MVCRFLEYMLRDFIHAEALAHSKTLIMIPGVLPPDPAQATRRRTGPDWTGDIWKLPEILQTHRPDLCLLILDVTPIGLLLITGLDPASTILSDKTQEILSAYQPMETIPEKVTNRTSAVAPNQRGRQGISTEQLKTNYIMLSPNGSLYAEKRDKKQKDHQP
jgi:hypothetical protein